MARPILRYGRSFIYGVGFPLKETSELVVIVKEDWVVALLQHDTTFINLCIDQDRRTGIVTLINGPSWEDFEACIERLSASTYRVRAQEFEMTYVCDFPFEIPPSSGFTQPVSIFHRFRNKRIRMSMCRD
jgi:hypothetical protein